MEEVRKNSGQALGTAALITGIISLVIAVIPCIGILAFVPGIVTIILAAVGLSQASRDDSPRGLVISGMVIGIVALLISTSQIAVGKRFINRDHEKFPKELREAIRSLKEDILKDIEDAKVNIRIESNGEKIEINAETKTDSNKEEFVKKLEELEKPAGAGKDSLPSK